ncbi:TIGR04222 domain-containing membrane protein [Saccharopolyspora rosea]|uniref:TIGR04222 domain-containing membrane protein n=1 Tax=Saccharopolyspora rosea TaxID=524884 RepID=UPI0021DA3770|nr:TIGR04222 domain-containing membrane protein [Saccharopolyspora rosea]
MGRPWGLSGPQFLLLYAVLLVCACFAFAAVRAWARRPPAPVDGRDLGLHELAYLRGGANRVVDAVVAGLVESGALRVDRSRLLHATAAARPRDAFEHEVLANSGVGTTMAILRDHFRARGLTDPIEDELVARGLLVTAKRRSVVVASAWLVPLLGVVGVVRAINGATHRYPVGFLVMELIVTAMVWVVLRGLARGLRRTTAGQRAAGPSTGQSAAHRVALRGLRAYPDRQIAALLGPSLVGSGAGGGGPAGDGGGGCGGGGCGGGGP